ncbi:unnamed protein product [Staurois parvus]|uniref:Uncharacterized protein n=1 Tax=Staurois parvus TaxID=386267 RepID=A0ABN9FMZ8_9NEOB|nr:unnamed protein product [Staurois parvus]
MSFTQNIFSMLMGISRRMRHFYLSQQVREVVLGKVWPKWNCSFSLPHCCKSSSSRLHLGLWWTSVLHWDL